MNIWTYWIVVLFLTMSCQGSPTPLKREKRVDDYHGKLEELNHEKSRAAEIANQHKESEATDVKNLKLVAREPMGSKYTSSNGNGQEKLKLLATRLVNGDEKALKALERAIDEERIEHEHVRTDSTGDDLGYNSKKYARDQTVDSASRDNKQVHDDIMTLLRNFRSRSNIQTENQGHEMDPRRRQQHQEFQEGYFGDFRQEVLNAVEERLLKDVRLALHSGFTIKDIINDLHSTQGEWEDTRKREIERELDTLESLKRNS